MNKNCQLLIIFLLFCQLPNIHAQIGNGSNFSEGPKAISTMQCLGKSIALSDLPAEDFSAEQEDKEDGIIGEIYNDFKRISRLKNPTAQGAVDGALQSGRNSKYSILPNVLFEGIMMTNVVPPDPSGDAGKDYYMQMVNAGGGAVFQIFDKKGRKIGNRSSLNSLWKQFGVVGLGDPIVLYDEAENRWLIAEMCDRGNGGDLNKLLIAVSTSNNPLGSWYAYELNTPTFPDYPKFFIWDNGYYVTTNEYVGNQPIYALEKSAMLLGKPAQKLQFGIPRVNIGFQIAMGVDWDGRTKPGSSPMIMQIADDAWGGGTDRLQIYNLQVDWESPAKSQISGPQRISVSAFNSDLCQGWNECIKQPNGRYIAAIDQLLSFRINYRNFGTHEAIVCCHVVNVQDKPEPHAGIRWYELRKEPGKSWNIYQQGTYSPDESDRYYPSISIDGYGNVALAYSLSNTTKYPSLHYTARRLDDPLGAMYANEYEFAKGLSNSNTERWGDYHHMAVDPADSTLFWFTGEYMNAGGQWSTKVVQFRVQQDLNDLLPSQVLTPVSAVNLSDQELISVKIVNSGKKAASNFAVGFIDQNGVVVLEQIAAELLTDSSMIHTFQSPYNFSNYGDYKFRFFTSFDKDDYRNNDTIESTISHRPKKDASLSKILDLGDFTCGSPHPIKLLVANSGFDTIKTIQLGYKLNNDTVAFRSWTLNLTKDNEKEVDISLTNLRNGQNTLSYFINKVNNEEDLRKDNDTLTTNFFNDSTLNGATLSLFTNNSPQENYWDLVDSKGLTIGSGGPYLIGSRLYKHRLCLKTGECYTFNLYDSKGNGMQSGTYYLKFDNTDKIINLLDANFGYKESNYFCPGKCSLKASALASVPSATNAKDGKIVVKVNGGAGPITYKLDNGSFQKSNTFDSLAIGTYQIIIKDDLGCVDSILVPLGLSNLDDLDQSKIQLQITPNPSLGYFSVLLEGANQAEPILLSIFNSLGQKVHEAQALNEAGTHKANIDLTKFATGSYFVKALVNKQFVVKKIILL